MQLPATEHPVWNSIHTLKNEIIPVLRYAVLEELLRIGTEVEYAALGKHPGNGATRRRACVRMGGPTESLNDSGYLSVHAGAEPVADGGRGRRDYNQNTGAERVHSSILSMRLVVSTGFVHLARKLLIKIAFLLYLSIGLINKSRIYFHSKTRSH